ncbi:MAG: hypothetical protein N0C84_03205 [Candidatus Thiodiazotropha taylori]|uniref:Uncharacterized protein n=1 Tax=Candidatus Thiodiazotropha taylori TaxID=2792791 RepID=A0A9E4N3X7_9GAMM|nr:hypothetical protein [Candidatus Thiodiazotropha taylori]MCG7945332.1 hypothetical protein [Candidatus Thiodiazotropha taylori]MCW4255446.1 hypothetical protein [Candidatus Thiodiazotropha taylori]MCW4255456.1 hypothetical protein [Candidatus Thiodiazotropha taylori]
MENFLIAMAGAAVSGLTYVAYKLPDLFEREFSQKIAYISIGILFAAIFHDTGVSSAQQELIPYIKDGVGEALKEALKEAKTNDYIYLASLGALFYGMFLSWLANHMKAENERKS